MKRFQRSDKFDNNRGGRDARNSSMYQAVCGDCGKQCEVPFKPTGDRPVYCSDCFSKQKDSGFSQGGRKKFDRPNYGDRPRFKAICAKCGKQCEVPFKPTKEKPVYCDNCFDRGSASRGSGPANDQLVAISAKLDQILEIIALKKVVKEDKTTATKKKTTKTKKKVVKKKK